MAGEIDPVLVGDAERRRRPPIDVQPVLAMIWRSQAFCEPQEWYIAIGRWVIACKGKASGPTSLSSNGMYQIGSGSK